MILHILMGQRKEAYPGEYAPEALAVIDENAHSDNPEYIAGEKAKYLGSDEFESLAVIDMEVSDASIMAILRPSAKTLRATIVGDDTQAAG